MVCVRIRILSIDQLSLLKPTRNVLPVGGVADCISKDSLIQILHTFKINTQMYKTQQALS